MTQSNTLIFDDEQTCAHITTDNHLTSKPLTLQKLIVDKNFENIFCNKDFPVESYLETVFIFFTHFQVFMKNCFNLIESATKAALFFLM